jgi:hypothetical protein
VTCSYSRQPLGGHGATARGHAPPFDICPDIVVAAGEPVETKAPLAICPAFARSILRYRFAEVRCNRYEKNLIADRIADLAAGILREACPLMEPVPGRLMI